MKVLPKLNMNKHPEEATNGSLIDAVNMMVSKDNFMLQTEPTPVTNKITDKLKKIVTNREYSIFYILPCNRELILFVNESSIVPTRFNIVSFVTTFTLDRLSSDIFNIDGVISNLVIDKVPLFPSTKPVQVSPEFKDTFPPSKITFAVSDIVTTVSFAILLPVAIVNSPLLTFNIPAVEVNLPLDVKSA